MNRWEIFASVLVMTAICTTGCSSGGNPVTPSAEQELTAASNPTEPTHTVLWGFYDVTLDLKEESVEAVPIRSAEFTMNIVKFLNNDPDGISFSFNGTTVGADYIDVDLDVTIKHPVDDPGFNGYDVRGIFIGEGSATLGYNGDLMYPVHGTDQILLNADGYSRWFNPTEFFIPKIWGYVAGNYASPDYEGSAILNPYKYFGEGLGPDDDLWDYLTFGAANTGYFLAETSNTRNYRIRFPNPVPGIKYCYAVTADWTGEAPDDHPSYTPEAVACSVIDNSDVYYVDPSANGGNLILDISLFGWEEQPTGIYIESSVLSAVAGFDSGTIVTGGSDQYSTYHVEIPADNVGGIDGQEFWVIAEHDGCDYSNNFGIPNEAWVDRLAAVFRYELPVSNEDQMSIQVVQPNGGEEFEGGTAEEITWVSNVTGTVFIEYSKDDFVSDVNVIATGEPNDGSYTWDSVPNDISDTVSVRISWTDDPGVNDRSDSYFSIIETGWVRTWGDSGSETGSAVAADSLGNIYVSGIFEGTVDFNPDGGDEHTSNGLLDAFLTKYDSMGNFEWARTWGGPEMTVGRSVSVAPNGDVYVVGCFWDTCDFDPGTETDTHDSNGNEDIFISKFDSSGDHLWARTWGGISHDYGFDVVISSSGKVYVTGYYMDTVDFDSSGEEDLHTSNGHWDVFLSAFDQTGDFEWAQTWGGPSEDIGNGVAWDQYGNAYVAGYFSGTVDFNPDGGAEHVSNGAKDVFLSSFYPVGGFRFALTWGGSADDGAYDVVGISTDIYVTGFFRDTVDFDPTYLVDIHTSNGDSDVFVSKIDFLADFFWAQTWGGLSFDNGIGVCTGHLGEVYVTGNFTDTCEFNPDGGDPHTSNGSYDIFLSRFDTSGIYGWVRTWGGIESDYAYGGCRDSSRNSYVTGFYANTVDFAPTGSPCLNNPDERTSNGNWDVFLTRHLPDGCW